MVIMKIKKTNTNYINSTKDSEFKDIKRMHSQKHSFDQDKLFYVLKSKSINVILRLRQKADIYKKFISVEIFDRLDAFKETW